MKTNKYGAVDKDRTHLPMIPPWCSDSARYVIAMIEKSKTESFSCILKKSYVNC